MTEQEEQELFIKAILTCATDGQKWTLKQSNISPKNKIEWESGTPVDDEIETEFNRLKTEWKAQEYSRNRQLEYPDWGTQLNKIYDDGLTKWKSEMVNPIKAKWPKDNSGPV